jgi:hypothetical protein
MTRLWPVAARCRRRRCSLTSWPRSLIELRARLLPQQQRRSPTCVLAVWRRRRRRHQRPWSHCRRHRFWDCRCGGSGLCQGVERASMCIIISSSIIWTIASQRSMQMMYSTLVLIRMHYGRSLCNPHVNVCLVAWRTVLRSCQRKWRHMHRTRSSPVPYYLTAAAAPAAATTPRATFATSICCIASLTTRRSPLPSHAPAILMC